MEDQSKPTTKPGLQLVYDEDKDDPPFNEVVGDSVSVDVETIYETNLRDIPTMLRCLADEIEEGEYGAVGSVACAVLGDELSVFGWGPNCNAGEVHLLLCAGANYMVQPIINKGK